MKMKFTFLMLLALSWNTFSQSKIIGTVVYLNSGKKPAVGVEIIAKGSSGDYSKSEGDYILNFPHNKAGTTVYPEIGNEIVINGSKIKKIELVNSEKLEAVNLPLEPTSAPLKIIVCPKGYRDEAAKKYYKIIRTEEKRILNKKNKELIAIKEKLGASHNLVKNLQDEIAHLKSQTNDSLKIYKEALEIASINRDDANQRVNDFLDALDAGIKIEEARKVLDTKKAFIEIVNSEHKMQAGIEEIERDAKSLVNLYRFEEAIQKYDTLSILLKRKMYNPIMLVNNLWDVGVLCQTQNFNKKGTLYYIEALSILNKYNTNNDVKASLLNNLGAIFDKQNQFSEALKNYNKALAIQRKLAQENSGRYSLDLIKSLNNLASLYAKRDESNKALSLFTEALQICKKAVQENPKDYSSELALLYNNIGTYFNQIKKYSVALTSLEEALKIRRNLAINDPKTHLPYVSLALNNIGTSYWGKKESELAIEKYKEALKIRRDLAADNPRAYLPYVADTSNNLGNLYFIERNEFELASERYREALTIYNKLSIDNPNVYNLLFGQVCYFYSYMKKWQLKKKFDPTIKKEALELINQGKKALEIYDNSNPTKMEFLNFFKTLEKYFLDVKE